MEDNQSFFEAQLKEIPLNSETMYEGSFFSIERLEVLLPDHNVSSRDILRHPGAVGIVAVDNDGRICVVRQWRAALDRITLEIPAGKMNVGEDPLDTAKRELAEETGITASNIGYLTSIAPACGYSDELIHIFLACDLTFKSASPDSDEFLLIDMIEADVLVDMILNGEIEDSKTISAVLMWDAIRSRLTN